MEGGMDLPTLREETCKRKLSYFRSMMDQVGQLSSIEKARLVEEMQTFCDSLSTGNVILGGAGIGLGAAILPVIGIITGPIIGGAYGAYKAKQLAHYRDEVLGMIKILAR
jgi:hypothetical protein